jgi:hypothetical protein
MFLPISKFKRDKDPVRRVLADKYLSKGCQVTLLMNDYYLTGIYCQKERKKRQKK